MKLLLAICLALAALTAPAQVFNFPAQGPTTAQFLTVSNAVGTNMVKLDTAQTITGAKTFPTSLFTANAIARRVLWSTNNLFVSSVTASASVFTNNGDFVNTTALVNVTVPGTIGSNSIVLLHLLTRRTNSNSTAASMSVFGGASSNLLYYSASVFPTSLGRLGVFPVSIFNNNNSFTSQYFNPQAAGAPVTYLFPSNSFGNSSTNFNFSIGLWTATTYTNVLVDSAFLEEIVLP